MVECADESCAVFCVDCQQELCVNCDARIHAFRTLNNHHRLGMNVRAPSPCCLACVARTHDVWSFPIALQRPSTGEVVCVNHPSRSAAFYCSVTHAALCVDCHSAPMHTRHTHLAPQEAAEQLSQQLSETLHQATEFVHKARDRLKRSESLGQSITVRAVLSLRTRAPPHSRRDGEGRVSV